VGGAVAGAVASVFTGGNVAANITTGAITSAAAGAAVGAMQPKPSQGAPPQAAQQTGAAQDTGDLTRVDPQPTEQAQELEKRIGPDNFDAARMLALCRHSSAIELARKAYTTADSPERREYSLMLEAIAAEEKGDTTAAASVYPRMLEADPTLGSVDKARSTALSGVLKVQQVRKDYGRAATCA
jgi:hypothetical protein